MPESSGTAQTAQLSTGPAVRYPACAVRVSSELTIPDCDGPEVVALGLTELERRAYIDLYYDRHSPNRGSWDDPGNRLLGHPFVLGSGSPLVEADFDSRGALAGMWDGVSPEQRLSMERQAAERWRLLMQIDSGEAAGMDWAGGGLLHFCIERSALASWDFSRTWLTMQVA